MTEVTVPLTLGTSDREMGSLTIHSDGRISGQFADSETAAVLVGQIERGFSNKIALAPNYVAFRSGSAGPVMGDYLTELEHVVNELTLTYNQAKTELEREIDKQAEEHPEWGKINPIEMRDTAGRPILLDALTAIVVARAAIVNGRKHLNS